jgi:RNA polymerase sigma-70 factor (ECF subfamily)
MTDVDFAAFIARIRAGDEEAAAELVRRYEPLIRREVRVRLSDARLGRLLESADVCQSVLASFFVRAASGQYDLEEPGQLQRLLLGMARNKLAFAARRHRYQCRDERRLADTPVEEVNPAGEDPTPSRIAEARELLAQVRQRLGEPERRIAERRAQGWHWAEIAAELGGTADALRMQLTRALDRVTAQLGLEETADA